MTTKIQKRAIPPVAGTNFKPTVEGLFVAVNELAGTIGENAQRAVRVCELLDAGIIKLDIDGALVQPGSGTGMTPSPGLYVEKAGDVMTGPISQANGNTFLQTAAGAKLLSGLFGQTLIVQAGAPGAGALSLRSSVGTPLYDFGDTLSSFACPLTVAGVITTTYGIVRAQGYGGAAESGVYYMGDVGTDCYMYRPNGIAQINFKRHASVAESILDSSGTIYTTGNFNPATKLNYRASIDTLAALITDWNTAVDNGWYMANAAANAPTAGWYMGKVTAHSSSWIQQEVWDFTQPAYTHRYRRHMMSGVWGAWTDTLFVGPNAFTGTWPTNPSYGGIMANDGTYIAMTAQSGVDSNSYFGAKLGGDVVLRPNNNDAGKQLVVKGTNGDVGITQALQSAGSNLVLGASGGQIYLRPNNVASASGEVIIGNTGNVTARDYYAIRPASPTTGVIFFGDQTGGSRYLFYDGSAYLFAAANVYANNFYATSDERLKKGIDTVLPDDRLATLALHTWNWRESGNSGRGVIAQHVRQFAPDYVHESPDGMLSVDKAGLALELALLALNQIKEQRTCH